MGASNRESFLSAWFYRYLVKAIGQRWEDGILGLEGGECCCYFHLEEVRDSRRPSQAQVWAPFQLYFPRNPQTRCFLISTFPRTTTPLYSRLLMSFPSYRKFSASELRGYNINAE